MAEDFEPHETGTKRNPKPVFRVRCAKSQCTQTVSSAHLHVAEEFIENHRHDEVVWMIARFDDPRVIEASEYIFTCAECGETWSFRSIAQAQRFRKNETAFTEHDLEWPPERRELDVWDEYESPYYQIKQFLKVYQDEYEGGIPQAHIVPGHLVGTDAEENIYKAIETMKQRGIVFEPRSENLHLVSEYRKQNE